MGQEELKKALVQSKRMGNLLNEVLDLSQQMAEALSRNDQVAVEMLIAMRQEPIAKLERSQQALRELTEGLEEPEDALRISLLLNGGEAENPEEQALANQVAANGRRLKQVLELDRVLSQKITRDKSIY